MTEFLKGTVVEALTSAGRPLKSRELARILDVPDELYREFRSFLKGLVDSGDLYRVKQGRYAPPDRINLVPGTLSVVRDKSKGAFLMHDRGGDDVWISPDGLGTACHGDKVMVRIGHRRRGRPEGTVVRVLERAKSEFIGSLRRTKQFAMVLPDDPRFHKDIYVPLDETGDAVDGEKVMVTILDWGSVSSGPVGKITESLGNPEDPGVDILMIIKNNGLRDAFPEDVEAAAAAIPDAIPAEEIATRLDLRDLMVLTIDPPTARDFDDALSLEEREDGTYTLGIHIADVSHYVRYDETLDREAYTRATSVYLVDRVLPMLPEKLSNNMCSLNPDVDRLAMSVLAHITPRGKLLDYSIEDTVIRSKRRLAYEDVQQLFDGDKRTWASLEKERDTLGALRSLAKALHVKRVRRGGLDFDLPSSRVLLDDDGLPVDIQKVVRTESNRLVEEFMLLANEIVARHLKKAKIPAMYRVHEDPQEQKLGELETQVAPFGYHLYPSGGKSDSISPKELQRILQQAEGKPEEYIVHMLVLRSLMRARYDIHPMGHFGLALKDYTHFTSPIRRYPDLLVHRILRVLSGRQKLPMGDERRFREWLEAAALHSSDRERLAEAAERDSVDLKKIEFMERHVGDVFEAVVSGVQVFGFFVELHRYHVSGLVHMNNLEDDYYEYWEDELSLVGSNTGRRFRVGDQVKVQVLAVKKELRQIDFIMLKEDMPAAPEESEGRRMRKARSDFEGGRKSTRPSSRRDEQESRRKRSGKKTSSRGTSGGKKSTKNHPAKKKSAQKPAAGRRARRKKR